MSKTETSTPRLSEYARAFIFPADIQRTVWPRVEAKGRELGIGFDWWQSQAGTVILGYREDGKYSATVGGVGMSIPRQVGKTYFVLAMIVILCILFPNLQVVWTAHHLRTSTKTFTTLRGLCRRKKVAPHVLSTRSGNGEQEVRFRNGSAIMFGARSQGFGRGFDEIDIEVFDEAQIMDTKALEDMVAAVNQSRHEHGGLLLFMGTPPRPSDPADAFRLRRAEALAGDAPDSVWLEIGADPKSDPDDQSQWARMNPSFPLRTPEESLLRLRKNLGDDDSWNREGRGVWDPVGGRQVIPADAWELCADTMSIASKKLVLAVDVDPDQSRATVALAGKRADGLIHVELYEQRSGVGWVAPWIVEKCRDYPVSGVVIDRGGPAAPLIDELAQLRVRRVKPVGFAEHADACSLLLKLVLERSIRHTGQPQLTASLAVAAKRTSGDRWLWSRKSAVSDITPLVAATLAVWGVQSGQVRSKSAAPRTPKRIY